MLNENLQKESIKVDRVDKNQSLLPEYRTKKK